MGTTRAETRAKPHYVNNREFSEKIVEHCKRVIKARENHEDEPQVTDYIATCFMKISSGLSYKPNFKGYTFRDEMVMDGVENCLRAINNYNVEAATQSGKPNAFGYFTQIIYFAFLRRIAKENKYSANKWKLIENSSVDDFIEYLDADRSDYHVNENHYFDKLIQRLDESKPPVSTSTAKSTHKPIGKNFKTMAREDDE